MTKTILSSLVAIALLTGCTEEKGTESKIEVEAKVTKEVKLDNKIEETKLSEIKTPEAKLVEQVKESGQKIAQEIVKESKKVAEAMPDFVKNVSEKVLAKTQEVSKELVSKTEEVTEEIVSATVQTKDKIEQSMNEIVATRTEATASSADIMAKGKGLYLRCAGCHGQTGETPALGKSQVIKGWDSKKIAQTLNGYKSGTYGGVMKGVMKSQVTNLSQEEIDALSAYIATF